MSKQLAEMSLDELKTQEKSLRFIIPIFFGVVLIGLVSSGYITYWDGFNIFTVLPIPLLFLVAHYYRELRKIQAEIHSRN
ncbi:hypothetical protein SAMN06269250_5858 [Spirosoma fluviale]|uniref:Uncharacterized protein n=1 Tax=Spirosoma fluviale TaxID=1597977 RepID=A0A286GQ27_9BACT|nr:hypothetical protein SAMN06269250_5858 [Spirosoma fluviale]